MLSDGSSEHLCLFYCRFINGQDRVCYSFWEDGLPSVMLNHGESNPVCVTEHIEDGCLLRQFAIRQSRCRRAVKGYGMR